MKNTLAIGAVILGAMLVYSGYKNWTIADTVKFFAGQGAPSDWDQGKITGKAGLPPFDPTGKPNYGKDGKPLPDAAARNPGGTAKTPPKTVTVNPPPGSVAT